MVASTEVTASDRAILFLLIRGESTTTAARLLGMSREGVERQLVALRAKLGVAEPAGVTSFPELRHVPPELRAMAVAVLPEIELSAFAPQRAKQTRAGDLLVGLAGVVEVAAVAILTVLLLVLALTLIADAFR
jgi:hypothetical protein